MRLALCTRVLPRWNLFGRPCYSKEKAKKRTSYALVCFVGARSFETDLHMGVLIRCPSSFGHKVYSFWFLITGFVSPKNVYWNFCLQIQISVHQVFIYLFKAGQVFLKVNLTITSDLNTSGSSKFDQWGKINLALDFFWAGKKLCCSNFLLQLSRTKHNRVAVAVIPGKIIKPSGSLERF